MTATHFDFMAKNQRLNQRIKALEDERANLLTERTRLEEHRDYWFGLSVALIEHGGSLDLALTEMELQQKSA